MNKAALFSGIGILLLVFLFSCVPKSILGEKPSSPEKTALEAQTSGKEAWQGEWERTLMEAKKEGRVVIYTGVPPITRTETIKGFKQRYQGIELEFLSGGGAELSQKIFSQRRAGLFLVDLYISGSTTMINVLKPAGVFDPLEPALILPQVKDPKVWWKSTLPFVDKERTIFSFIAGVGSKSSTSVNTEVIRPEEINSYYDLLAPKFKDKIVMIDPTISGKGERQVVVSASHSVLGWDYFRELVKQRPVLTRNARLQVEWIVQKKFLVGLSADEGIVLEFKEAGAPLEIFGLKEEVLRITGSFGQVSLINKPPHPDATKVFINWLLDREGAEIWAKTLVQQSARVDVSAEHLVQAGKPVRQEGVSYYMSEDEEEILRTPERQKIVKEIFGPLLR